MSEYDEIKVFSQITFRRIWENFTDNEFVDGFHYSRDVEDELFISVSAVQPMEDAVLCSQYFLRNFCRDFLLCVEDSLVNLDNFKFCVYFLLDNWIRHRKDVFIKVVDCFAIIAEAVLFLKEDANAILETNSPSELFYEYFMQNLYVEFYEKVGLEMLERKARVYYSDLHSNLGDLVQTAMSRNVNLIYDQILVDILRNSPVMFPVPYSEMSENSVDMLGDEANHRFKFDRSIEEIFYRCSHATCELCVFLMFIKIDRSVLIEFTSKIDSSYVDFSYVFVGGSSADDLYSMEMSYERRSSLREDIYEMIDLNC